jgi:hypothetical protein
MVDARMAGGTAPQHLHRWDVDETLMKKKLAKAFGFDQYFLGGAAGNRNRSFSPLTSENRPAWRLQRPAAT